MRLPMLTWTIIIDETMTKPMTVEREPTKMQIESTTRSWSSAWWCEAFPSATISQCRSMLELLLQQISLFYPMRKADMMLMCWPLARCKRWTGPCQEALASLGLLDAGQLLLNEEELVCVLIPDLPHQLAIICHCPNLCSTWSKLICVRKLTWEETGAWLPQTSSSSRVLASQAWTNHLYWWPSSMMCITFVGW